MKYAVILVAATCLAFTTLFLGQDSESSIKPRQKDKRGPIDILSDTKGFDMKPYLKQVWEKVRTKWYDRIPDASQPPISKKGHVFVRFRVMKDGHINDVKYIANSGDETLDRAAYGAVTASDPLWPLPSEFACQYIVLGIKFYYNPGPGDVTEKNVNDQVLPCVTSKIQFSGALAITVSPGSVQVAVGTKQQFHAMITDAEDSP